MNSDEEGRGTNGPWKDWGESWALRVLRSHIGRSVGLPSCWK